MNDLYCGCNIIKNGGSPYVEFCSLHAAAEDLLSAVKLARGHLMTKARKDVDERQVVEHLRDAYSKATGGTDD